MPSKSRSINLLHSQEKGLFEKFLNWALTVGRFLVIITETIALGMFLYRFTLDRQIIDLHGEIKNKQAVIQTYEKDEEAFRSLQARLTEIKVLDAISTNTATMAADIVSMAKGNVTFNTMSMSRESVLINIETNTTGRLGAFIQSLKAYPRVQTVSIDTLDNKTADAKITAVINITLKP